MYFLRISTQAQTAKIEYTTGGLSCKHFIYGANNTLTGNGHKEKIVDKGRGARADARKND
ncbi:MAG: hypothetical protein AAB726_00630 [Patescibacteria group bacterium]